MVALPAAATLLAELSFDVTTLPSVASAVVSQVAGLISAASAASRLTMLIMRQLCPVRSATLGSSR